MTDESDLESGSDLSDFAKYYLSAEHDEKQTGTTPVHNLARMRSKTLRLHALAQKTMSNESTCLLLKHHQEEYSQLLSDNSQSDSVDYFSKPIEHLLKGKIQTDHCSKWKSGLRSSNIDIMELIKENLIANNHCNIKNDLPCPNGNITEDELKLFLECKNSNISKLELKQDPPKVSEDINTNFNTNFESNNIKSFQSKQNNKPNENVFKKSEPSWSSTNSVKQPNMNFSNKQNFNPLNNLQKVNFFNKPNNSNDSKININEEKKSNEGAPFKTARAELMIQNKKKYGNAYHNHPQENNASAPKRSLGTTRSVQNKFVPPKVNSNKVEDEEMPEETVQDERLKHIDPKMVELIRSEIIDSSAPIGWDDIAGLEFAKSAIQEAVVWPLLRPDIFTGLRRPPKGILLFGPPGTGKTLIGKCIASQCCATFFSISASSLTSKWLGDGEKMVRALFAVARCHQPAVVFIDEIDSLLTQRTDSEHEATRRIKTEFLVQLDGAATGDEDRLLLIGATNRPQELDEAARRRLVKRLYIPLPDVNARKQIIMRLMMSEKCSMTENDVLDVAHLAEGFSGADMRSLCSEAALGPIRAVPLSQITNIQSDQVRPVDINDFKKALTRVRPSVSSKDLEHYIKWDETYGSGNIHC